MESTLDDLKDLVGRHAVDGHTQTGIARFSLARWPEVTSPVSRLVEPRICLALQGAKSITVGGTTMEYGQGQYFAASIEVPVIDRVSEANHQRPYLGILLSFDTAVIAGLLLDMPSISPRQLTSGMGVSAAEPEMLDAFLRVLRLMDRPDEIAMIGPLIEREILFRLLQGPQGSKLRQMARLDSRLSHIRRATTWIRQNYTRPFKVEELAELVGMSATSFHRHFKATTNMTPIQYQKQFRLYQARQLLLAAPGNTAAVAFSVGYESSSQFSREYARLFGTSPARDAKSLRKGLLLEQVPV